MYIQTEFGLRKVGSETVEIILIDFYGEGLHETLEKAKEDNEEIDLLTFKTEQARVYWS
jgi:hypothetical protein